MRNVQNVFRLLSLGTIVFVLTLFLVPPAIAQSADPAGPPGWVAGILTAVFTPLLVKQLLTLVGLILLQVILAVALSIRNSNFDLQKVADFYRVMVAPFVIGWLAFVFVTKLISADLLGPTYGVIVGDGVTWLSWLAVVASLGARIVSTVKDLYGTLSPFGDKANLDSRINYPGPQPK